MTHTTNLSLPYLLPNQAQKHVTHNEALKMLDVLVQLSVVDNTLSAPPQSPSEGDSYTIATSPTGVWAGKENQVTIWHDGAWSFYAPDIGWVSWVANQNALMAYDGTDWVVVSGSAGELSTSDLSDGTITTLGVNATADTTNRLSINSGAILFNKEVDDVQVKLNKQASTDNASFLFQTNFSGRAEIGTTGDDDFHFKVSSDGTTWKEGILIDASTGAVSFPNTTLNVPSTTDLVDNLVTRVFNRISPTQWGFCHVVSEAYTDLAKTTKAIVVDDVIAVIEDKSPNNLDLVAGGTDAANKIKLRLDPATIGVDEAHATTHFLKVTVPTGGFRGTLITAYRGGCLVHRDLDVLAGDWEIWSGDSMAVDSGFIGAFAAENISNTDIEKVLEAFYHLGADSKPLLSPSAWCINAANFSKIIDLSNFDFSASTSMYQLMRNTEARKVILHGEDLSSVTTMSYAFYACSNLTSLDVSNWGLSSVTTMSYAFYECSNLTSLDVSNWDLSSVTTMSYAFYACSNLTSLDVSIWGLSSVTTMSYAFYECSNLTSLDVSNWDLSSVTNLRATFRNCNSLTSLDVSNWDLTSVTDVYTTFYGCNSLTSLDVSNWDLSSVTTMSYAFYACSNLTSLDVSNWDLSSASNLQATFRNCSNLTSLDISSWDLSNVTNMDLAFFNCSKLTSLNVGSAFDNTSCVKFSGAFNNCALDQQSVDDILVSIENAGTSNGTLNMTGTNVSAPSSVGAAAKTALQGRGWTVTTNA